MIESLFPVFMTELADAADIQTDGSNPGKGENEPYFKQRTRDFISL